jgi:hypothetical protein
MTLQISNVRRQPHAIMHIGPFNAVARCAWLRLQAAPEQAATSRGPLQEWRAGQTINTRPAGPFTCKDEVLRLPQRDQGSDFRKAAVGAAPVCHFSEPASGFNLSRFKTVRSRCQVTLAF